VTKLLRLTVETLFLTLVAAFSAQPVQAQPAPLFSLPITGQLSNGVPAAGQATAYNNGVGEFWVQFPGSMRCTGTYAVRDPNPTIVVPVTCGSRIRREAVITRQADLMSGTAIVGLNNGKRGQFVFGNLTFEQAFGQGRVRTH
jgi:hypothetical protein